MNEISTFKPGKQHLWQNIPSSLTCFMNVADRLKHLCILFRQAVSYPKGAIWRTNPRVSRGRRRHGGGWREKAKRSKVQSRDEVCLLLEEDRNET